MPDAFADFIFLLLRVFTFLLIGRAIASWIDPGLRSTIGRALYEATEPIVGPVRSVMPRTGFLDLSLFATLILIQILRQVLAQILYS
ncbi:MAG: YggT family protein [Thermomicrobiales bacterium]